MMGFCIVKPLNPPSMEFNIQTAGYVFTAFITFVCLLKFKLIEEFVRKISSNDENTKGKSVVLLFVIIAVLSITTYNLPVESNNNEVQPATSDAEAIAETTQAVAGVAEKLIDKKHKNDSIFKATRSERWVYQIGDWTDDEEEILELYSKLSSLQNVKVFRQKKAYIFIKEDYLEKQQLENALDSLKSTIGLSVATLDINSFLKNKRKKIVERIETFGRRKNRISLECLIVD
jgi:hypothetical protein